MNKIPNYGYISFTDEEKANYPIKTLIWKHEGHSGPVHVIFHVQEKDTFMGGMRDVFRNYQDSDTLKGDGEGYYAEWFTMLQAEKIAKKLGVPIEY